MNSCPCHNILGWTFNLSLQQWLPIAHLTLQEQPHAKLSPAPMCMCKGEVGISTVKYTVTEHSGTHSC